MKQLPGFIASVGPDRRSTSDTRDFPWFALRQDRRRPYNVLHVKAPLYWYDPSDKAIFLLTRLTKVEQCEYEAVDSLRQWLVTHYGKDPSSDPYFIDNAPKCRYCVAFWVRPLQRLNLPIPQGCKFDQGGWLPCDSETGRLWLPPLESSDPDGPYGPQLRSAVEQLASNGYFDPKNLADERQRKMQEVVQRRGQPEFRASMIDAYSGRCAITGCDALQALEAAHIMGYSGPQSNHVSNGLLLRADIHTLFDLDLIGIEPHSLHVVLADQLQGTCYDEFSGKPIAMPSNSALRASKKALEERWKRFRADAEPA